MLAITLLSLREVLTVSVVLTSALCEPEAQTSSSNVLVDEGYESHITHYSLLDLTHTQGLVFYISSWTCIRQKDISKTLP